MGRTFTLIYWKEDNWYIGKLKETPGIISQAKTLKELKKNIKDAYNLMNLEKGLKLTKVNTHSRVDGGLI